MKLTVSKEEMLELLSRALQTKVTDFTISKGPHALAIKFDNGMTREFGAERPFPAHRKIEAIKLLRTLSSELIPETMGLADAKCAVENYERWISFVRSHGRVPKIQDHWSSDPTLL